MKKACQEKNEQSIFSQIQNYKMSALRDEIVKGNGYFYNENLKNARILFRYRVELYEVKMNFKNKSEYKMDDRYLCNSCESETNSHILFRPTY